MTQPIWAKGIAADDWVTRFTVGDDYRWDTLLLPYDCLGTQAHARALARLGLLTADEVAAITQTLDDAKAEAEAGTLVVRVEDEDMHTVLERVLTERLGATGQKIHAGRSRNDQVLVALRLFLKDALRGLAQQTRALAEALLDRAATTDALLLPGYTHFQRAMPSTVALWLAGYAELLAADLDGLQAAYAAIDVSPWGSAAGYGVPHLDLPRAAHAADLGFADLQVHVTTPQLSRGKLEATVVHALVQVGATINRLASDLVLYSTAEYGFVSLPASHTTGSSIMPQKRNPDVFELARASYHRLVAELHLLLTLPANLPSGYHRDLQLTKEAVVRAVLLSRDLLTAMQEAIPGLQFNADRMQAALSPDLFATADANARVQQGTPFRVAYREAAAALPTLTTPPTAEALAAYTTPGTPGHVQIEALRERLHRPA